MDLEVPRCPNTISTISGQGAITGLNIGAAGTASTVTVGNAINTLVSSGTGGIRDSKC
jgi:hypothetical protein